MMKIFNGGERRPVHSENRSLETEGAAEDDSSDDEKNTIKIHPITPVSTKRNKSAVGPTHPSHHFPSSPLTKHKNLINNLWPPSLSRQSSRESRDLFDDRNVILVNLQRKKVLSYAENTKLEREVEELRAQLLLLENLEKKGSHESAQSNFNNAIDSSQNVSAHKTSRAGSSGVSNVAASSSSNNNNNNITEKYSRGRLSRHPRPQQSNQVVTYEESDEDQISNASNKVHNARRRSGRKSAVKSSTNNRLESAKSNNSDTSNNEIGSRSTVANDNGSSSNTAINNSVDRRERRHRQTSINDRSSGNTSTVYESSIGAAGQQQLSRSVRGDRGDDSLSSHNTSLRPRRRDRQAGASESSGVVADEAVTSSLDSNHGGLHTLLSRVNNRDNHAPSQPSIADPLAMGLAVEAVSGPSGSVSMSQRRPHFHRMVNVPSSSGLIPSPRSIPAATGGHSTAALNTLNIEGQNPTQLANSRTSASVSSISQEHPISEYIPSNSSAKSLRDHHSHNPRGGVSSSKHAQKAPEVAKLDTASVINDVSTNPVSSRQQSSSSSTTGIIVTSSRRPAPSSKFSALNTNNSNNNLLVMAQSTEPVSQLNRRSGAAGGGGGGGGGSTESNNVTQNESSNNAESTAASSGRLRPRRLGAAAGAGTNAANPSSKQSVSGIENESLSNSDECQSQTSSRSNSIRGGALIQQHRSTRPDANDDSTSQMITSARVQETLNIIANTVANTAHAVQCRKDRDSQSSAISASPADSTGIASGSGDNANVSSSPSSSKLPEIINTTSVKTNVSANNHSPSSLSSLSSPQQPPSTSRVAEGKDKVQGENEKGKGSPAAAAADDTLPAPSAPTVAASSGSSILFHKGRTLTHQQQPLQRSAQNGNHHHHHPHQSKNKSPIRSSGHSNAGAGTSGLPVVGAAAAAAASLSKFEQEMESDIEQGRWTNTLSSRWEEVRLLLRKPIAAESDMHYTAAAAEAGLMFTDQLNDEAKALHVMRGTLSRWLLPYDNNTRIDEQSSTAASVLDSMPDNLQGKIAERRVHYLVTGLNNVRKLIRVKIADDNDLEQARQALKTTVVFFKELHDVTMRLNDKAKNECDSSGSIAVEVTMFRLLEKYL